jgi:DNA-binding transcriptional LysR family regulator
MAQGTLTLERYRAAGHVVMVPATTQFPALEGYFLQQQGIDRRVEARSYSFIATAAMLVGTDRIATLHRRLALVAQRAFPITLHEPPVAIGTMGQTMQWHKYRTQDPGLRWLRQLLHDAVAAMDHRGAGGSRPPPAAEGAAP